MELAGKGLVAAANEMVMQKLPELGGDRGLIAVDKDGNIAMPFNTAGMYRGYKDANGATIVEFLQITGRPHLQKGVHSRVFFGSEQQKFYYTSLLPMHRNGS